ncbi:MAG: hypothetical protein AVDCRST_MAG31-1127 [uncultured Sphingomonas sp.]|uniref:Uncharacterized protein n=1 Tax=uncultured Sphingomonas sp. TaxID=158754 RepID=A0A6J4T4N1_9SPHN|nr:hypothetical protein [uncultured Sphingomonas sp.]CAA9513430.1 MAG: hypothetical protein AVDCRST_MAG31-1127 [uncultured Sphingomonas sp.]
MDSYREFEAEPGPAFDADGSEAAESDSPTSERRMQVRAFNYWASLLDGRDYPSIEDLEPASVADFAGNSVLLDFTAGALSPSTAYLGAALRRECGLDVAADSPAEVPAGSLLARLADHYDQILESRAPVGIEADFVNQRGASLRYRGIMMPFSSDGDTVDFVYGVFDWSSAREPAANEPVAEVPPGPPPPSATGEHLAWQDGPMRDPDVLGASEEASLDDWLSAARVTAEDAKAADGRSRQALYRALSLAYDFACAAAAAPADYGKLLEEAGIAAQSRAPMTAVAKLVFGADHDKARLTEYAAALSYAARQEVAEGGFLALIEAQPGGLKALVEAERRVRRPDVDPAGWRERACTALRAAAPRPLEALAGNGEFALVLVRRSASGAVAPVAAVPDPAMLDRALRRAAA